MKIAICLSGQPRTWKKCYKTWLNMFSPHGEIDFYFHLWNYNTLPKHLVSQYGAILTDESISQEEQNEIIETLNPKKYIFESKKKITYWNIKLPNEKQFGPWCAEQFYSQYRASLLKREYEIENNFRYDLVVRVRSDLYIFNSPKVFPPTPNTLHTTHCSWDKTYNCYRIGDIFFYADSHTFDQVSEFFKFLSFTSTDWVTSVRVPPPEIAMYFYLANIGILNNPQHIMLKIMRDKKILDVKPFLDNYEITQEL